jgi:ketosteroid isomerase-like protein
LQHLSATQRAALILRDVPGVSAAEMAGQLDTSTAAVNGAPQRARTAIGPAAPTQQTVPRDLGDAAVNDIAARWAGAWQAGDVSTIVAMLAGDARYSMPPLPQRYQGRDQIRAFPLHAPLQSRGRFLPTRANGQIAFGTYRWDDAAGADTPGGLDARPGCGSDETHRDPVRRYHLRPGLARRRSSPPSPLRTWWLRWQPRAGRRPELGALSAMLRSANLTHRRSDSAI